jgi:hypothetical protein
MYLKEIECEDMDSIHVAQDRVQCWALVYTVINHRVRKRL